MTNLLENYVFRQIHISPHSFLKQKIKAWETVILTLLYYTGMIPWFHMEYEKSSVYDYKISKSSPCILFSIIYYNNLNSILSSGIISKKTYLPIYNFWNCKTPKCSSLACKYWRLDIDLVYLILKRVLALKCWRQ